MDRKLGRPRRLRDRACAYVGRGSRRNGQAVRLFFALLMFASAAAAQDRTFHDPFIDRLAGDWTLTRQIRGKELENTVHAEWVLNHQFLRVHMKDSAQPPAYE